MITDKECKAIRLQHGADVDILTYGNRDQLVEYVQRLEAALAAKIRSASKLHDLLNQLINVDDYE